MPVGFRENWEALLQDGRAPRYLRSVRRTSFDELRRNVRAGRPEFATEFVDSIGAGDCWVVERALTGDQVEAAKHSLRAFSAATPESHIKMLEGCANYHNVMDGTTAPVGGYTAIDHSLYFFRWNGDDHGLFAAVDEVWRLSKILSGHPEDRFLTNTPKDLLIDRIQAIHYPTGVGSVSGHVDPFVTMRTNTGLFLSTHGADFGEGGFWIARKAGEPVAIDPQMKAGDLVLWFPNLVHGVSTIDPSPVAGWNATDTGRWYLALNTVESNYVQDRHITKPAH
jgi:hypothetical protein